MLLGKYLAYLACTVLLVLPSVVLVYFLIVPTRRRQHRRGVSRRCWPISGCWRSGWPPTARVFALVGARLKRPLVVGLVFAFGWEPAVLLFPGYLKRLTVAYYLQALVPHAMPQDSAVSVLLQVFQEVPSVCGQPGVRWRSSSAVALWLAGRAVEQREYVLEQ